VKKRSYSKGRRIRMDDVMDLKKKAWKFLFIMTMLAKLVTYGKNRAIQCSLGDESI
jgi:hypothetical protein